MTRIFGDRIMLPTKRKDLFEKFQEICKSEFLLPEFTPERISKLVFGNYHVVKQKTNIFEYSKQPEDKMDKVRSQLRKTLKNESNNHYLDAFLDCPTAVDEIFRLSRVLYRYNGHAMIVNPPGSGSREFV